MSEKEGVRQTLLDLNKKRDEIEKEILSYQSILKSHNVDMNDSLVDSEGYPRNDIDVYAIRTARSNIITKQNDARAIMKQIEDLLHKFHSM